MNILQIVSSSRISGAEKHVVVLSEYLCQRGHRVFALCPPGGWLPDQLRAVGVSVTERKMHGTQFTPTAFAMAQFARDNAVQVVHTHLTCATYCGYLVGRLTHLPIISSVHVRSRDLVYRRLFPQPGNHIITVSEWVREGFLRQGVPADQVHTIYNGTEFCKPGLAARPQTERESEILPARIELNLPPDAELIGIFARVDEFKGHHILVQALRKIVAARPRAYVVCVGAVEPKMKRALWEIAAADGVAERLRFTGVRNDVQRLLTEIDVVTLPSRYEACSMAIIEAMALGKPVVATRAGGNPELITDAETGLLIERNPNALANAMISLLEDAANRKRMGEAARKLAETRFSAAFMVDNIERLYNKMVTQKTTARSLA